MPACPVAIVTGGSRGIGRAVCEALGQAGYSVVVNYARNAEAAQQVVHQIRQAGGQAEPIQAIIGDPEQQRRLVDATVDRFGEPHVLVNNAGITSPGRKDILEATEENWETVFSTNLKGPFFLTQAVANRMIDARQDGQLDRGTVINVSSVSAFSVSTNRADYCLTKSAMQMMTWLFAMRLAEHNIGVYEICPGIIQTDMTAEVRGKYDTLIEEGLTPIRRWGQPEDIANAVMVLVKGQLAFTTGERIHVDGGYHIRQL